jgi:hypothetical protein
MRDVSDRDVMNVIFTCYGEAMAARGPLAHRFSTTFDDVEITYDQIIFLTVNKADKIDRLITLSAEISRK